MLRAMFDMRRLRSAEVEEDDEPPSPYKQFRDLSPAAEQQDAEGGMLQQALLTLTDTSATLQRTEENTIQQLGLVVECGGAKHASTALAFRVLEVVRRKRCLLQDVEARIAALEAEIANQDELLRQVIAGELKTSPPELATVEEFVDSMTHPGKLIDADRSDFVGFVSTFKLPAKHRSLEYMRSLRMDCAEWWAEACVSEAEKGTGYLAVKRLHDMRRALEQARLAKERWETGQLQPTVENSVALGGVVATPGEDADIVEKHIMSAIKEGVSTADPRMRQARLAVKALRSVDFARRRQEEVIKRRQGQQAAQK